MKQNKSKLDHSEDNDHCYDSKQDYRPADSSKGKAANSSETVTSNSKDKKTRCAILNKPDPEETNSDNEDSEFEDFEEADADDLEQAQSIDNSVSTTSFSQSQASLISDKPTYSSEPLRRKKVKSLVKTTSKIHSKSTSYPLFINGSTTYVTKDYKSITNWGTFGYTYTMAGGDVKGRWKTARYTCLGVLKCTNESCKYWGSPPTGQKHAKSLAALEQRRHRYYTGIVSPIPGKVSDLQYGSKDTVVKYCPYDTNTRYTISTPSLVHIRALTERSMVDGFIPPRSRQQTSAAAEKVLSTAHDDPQTANIANPDTKYRVTILKDQLRYRYDTVTRTHEHPWPVCTKADKLAKEEFATAVKNNRKSGPLQLKAGQVLAGKKAIKSASTIHPAYRNRSRIAYACRRVLVEAGRISDKKAPAVQDKFVVDMLSWAKRGLDIIHMTMAPTNAHISLMSHTSCLQQATYALQQCMMTNSAVGLRFYSHGSPVYYHAHFLQLMKMVKDAPITPPQQVSLIRTVVNLSAAHTNGFIKAYMDVFEEYDRDQALSGLNGCQEHYRASVT
ncbi:hypothetical protein DFH28DRAFT_1125610 [Melampsora americana]|nr:hypothetical protein DFH28DRAFT_1125610 [Melampsora americana]